MLIYLCKVLLIFTNISNSMYVIVDHKMLYFSYDKNKNDSLKCF